MRHLNKVLLDVHATDGRPQSGEELTRVNEAWAPLFERIILVATKEGLPLTNALTRVNAEGG
jgi:hypothetical protein